MNKKSGFSVLGILLFAAAQLSAQDTVFSTGFEYDLEPIVFAPSDLDGADGQVGGWSGDDFPEGIGDILTLPDAVGFIDNPNGGRALLLDRPSGDFDDGSDFIGSYFANLDKTVLLLGAKVSFDVGTRRTGGNNEKDYDIVGRDSSGAESFRVRVGTNNNGGERLGVVTDAGATVLFDLPTVVGEDMPADLDNMGAPPFTVTDQIGSVNVLLGASGYAIDFTSPNNSYTTGQISYNGGGVDLAQIEFTYEASTNTGRNSGYILDNILVTGFEEILQGDFDFNGTLDFADFTILADNFGTGTTVEQGDFNFDGRVDLADFAGLKAAFNAQGGATAAAVPEPSAALLSLVGAMGLGVLRRRRDQRSSKESKLADTAGIGPTGVSTWCWIIVAVAALQFSLFSTSRAEIVLGTGTGALLGGDLTDPENDGDPEADDGYNAIFDANDEPGFGGGEFSFNVFDNVLGPGNDKWCCGAAGGFPEEGLWVEAQLQSPPAFLTHFTVSSANDTPDRDPTHWTISGSNDGVNYATIYEYEGASLWTERLQVIQFAAGEDFANQDTSYQTFRFTAFDSVLNPTGAYFQIGEIEFFGDLKAVIPGDFNEDGMVDFSDATILADNFGTGSLFEQGDMNRDGAINLKDFVSFRDVFLSQGQAATAAVPEPGTFTLLGLAAASLLLRRRRV